MFYLSILSLSKILAVTQNYWLFHILGSAIISSLP